MRVVSLSSGCFHSHPNRDARNTNLVRDARWFDHHRLHGEIGLIPPAELEAHHWANNPTQAYPETPAPVGAGSK